MKYLLSILIIICFFSSCKRTEYGSVQQQIKCESGLTTNSKSLKSTQELRYSQFGSHVMSFTPDSFIVKIFGARYFDSRPNMGNALVLLGPETVYGEDGISVDFARDSIISIVPFLQGNVYQNGEGGFFKEDVTFDLFHMATTFYLQINLPVEYGNIILNQFISQQNGKIITTTQYPLTRIVEKLNLINSQIMHMYFGKTDSTYIEIRENQNPVNTFGTGNMPYIRSAKFEAWTLTPPINEITKTITSTIAFNYKNIIQVYAGVDEIPYTADDVFVFEPNFWERFSVNVVINEN